MTDSNKEILRISKNVVKWLVEQGISLTQAGLGQPDPADDGEFTVGLIDEVDMNSPLYPYISALIQYVRLVVSIIEDKDN
jgi:hypothetical protein